MTPTPTDLILARLDRFEDGVNGRLDTIEQQARLTNGRVTTLEKMWARLEGAKWALSWMPALLTGVGTGVIVALVAALIA